MSYHLPPLHNPLLNVLFNNPLLAAMAPLVQDLRLHNDITILVPPATSIPPLLSEDFIRSHIIRNSLGVSLATTARKVHLFIYTSLNGKQLLLKNGHVFTGKGFRASRKVAVLGFDDVAVWADYLPRGLRYACVYLLGPLCGDVHEALQLDLLGEFGEARNGREAESTGKKERSGTLGLGSASVALSALALSGTVAFSDLLQSFPALSRTMAPAFYSLFHHNNRLFLHLRSRKRLPLAHIKLLFAAMVAEAFHIVQGMVNADSTDGDRVYNLLTSVTMKNPALDMNRLVHEFVEFNVYDRLWALLVFQFTENGKIGEREGESGKLCQGSGDKGKPGEGEGEDVVDFENHIVLTPQLYRDLLCLSLNQLDIPVDEPWTLNSLYRRVEDAIAVFAELTGSRITNQREKVAILTRTVQVLTESGLAPLVDADTLIGLLIMVIVHLKVPNLECHLYYIQNFGYSSGPLEQGYLNYILLNFDAVVYHLQGPNTKEKKASSENYTFWAAIQREDYTQVDQLLDIPHASLPKSHFLHSKNIHGESFWFLAIRTKNTALFELLLEKTLHFICIEDMVFDVNTRTEQNLLMAALQHENQEIILYLIDIFVTNLSPLELKAYINSADHRGRTVGHYLSHNLAALEALGDYVDWGHKDHNSHTPLFSFCRSYDHPAYKELISAGFRKSNVGYNVHTDKTGNTLLHALSRAIPESGIFSNNFAVDVNELNTRGLSPASLYIRYNRLENLEVIFREQSLVFDLEDPKCFYTLLDNYSFSAAKKNSSEADGDFMKIEKMVISAFFLHSFPRDACIGIISGKYDQSSKDWVLHTLCREGGKTIKKSIFLNALKKIFNIFWLSNTLLFLPMDRFWLNFPATNANNPTNAKYTLNRTIEHTNMFLLSIPYMADGTQALLRELVHRDAEKELVFEVAEAISASKVPLARLTPQHIQEMYYFIDYSKKDLVNYKQVVRKLSNLASFGLLKHKDMLNSQEALFAALKIRRSASKLDCFGTFYSFVSWVESCTDHLILHCETLFGKLHLWETIYKTIKAINVEITELEGLVLKKQEIQRKSTFSLETVPADECFKEESDFTLLFGLADTKKAKYKRLVAAKAEHVGKISALSSGLRQSHETIAAEISQFFVYRLSFLSLGIKRFANDSMVSLRHRNVALEKSLESVRTR